MVSPTQFKAGMVIKVANKLYAIVSYQHTKPGKGPAYYRTKLKDIENGVTQEKTFRANEKIEDVFLKESKLIYLYRDSNIYFFMDQADYNQIPINKKIIEDIVNFLKENTEVTALSADSKIIQINLSNFIELKVQYTEPAIKGDTAKSTTTKIATLETGAKIQVPLFINKGDRIKLDTRIKQYAGKAK